MKSNSFISDFLILDNVLISSFMWEMDIEINWNIWEKIQGNIKKDTI
jgi:hypothetical protein